MMTETEQPTSESTRPVRPSPDDLDQLSREELVAALNTAFDYIESLKQDDIQALRDSEEKCRQQVADVTRRENMLLKSLTEKEREVADLAAQIEELKQYQLPSTQQLRTMLLEPTVNVVINRLKKELESTKQRLEESQSELNAWKFTHDSQTGKQLMARCRTLLKENEELGKQISQGRIAKLEGEIALEKRLVEEMKVAQYETEQFVMELDDDTEGLQATVLLLQQQLKEAKDLIDALESSKNSSSQKALSPDVGELSSAGQRAQLTKGPSNPGEPVTLTDQLEVNASECNATIPNGSMELTEVGTKVERTSSEGENGLTSKVGNGYTEMMVTN